VKFDPEQPNIIINRSCPAAESAKRAHDRAYSSCVAKGYSWNTTYQRCNTAKEQRAQESTEQESRANQRDANGETYAEYCSRMGYGIEECPAG